MPPRGWFQSELTIGPGVKHGVVAYPAHDQLGQGKKVSRPNQRLANRQKTARAQRATQEFNLRVMSPFDRSSYGCRPEG